jgi:hypothetical protein
MSIDTDVGAIGRWAGTCLAALLIVLGPLIAAIAARRFESAAKGIIIGMLAGVAIPMVPSVLLLIAV